MQGEAFIPGQYDVFGGLDVDKKWTAPRQLESFYPDLRGARPAVLDL